MKHTGVFIERLLKFIAKHDMCCSVFWDENLNFNINCNDFFFWGCADCVDITEEYFFVLEKSIEQAGDDGALLYCARIRKMRPQGAAYKFIYEKNKKLFDECGPEREVGTGNPESQYKQL